MFYCSGISKSAARNGWVSLPVHLRTAEWKGACQRLMNNILAAVQCAGRFVQLRSAGGGGLLLPTSPFIPTEADSHCLVAGSQSAYQNIGRDIRLVSLFLPS